MITILLALMIMMVAVGGAALASNSDVGVYCAFGFSMLTIIVSTILVIGGWQHPKTML